VPLPVRLSFLALALALGGCGSSTISVYLNSSESTAPLRQGLAANETLTRAKQVRLTVESVAIHLSPVVFGSRGDPSDSAGWTELIDAPVVVDLMNLRADQTKLLGEAVLPSATGLTQVRLRLRTDGPGPAGLLRIRNAVIDAADRTCDLLVPERLSFPGLSTEGGLELTGQDGHLDVFLSIPLDNSAELTEDPEAACTWSLDPVLNLRPPAAEDPEDP